MFQRPILTLFQMLITVLLIPTLAVAQELDKTSSDTMEYLVVEDMPQFPGGNEALLKYIGEHVNYPKKDIEKQRDGTVYIEFVIDKDGSVTKVKHRKIDSKKNKPTKDMIKEAIRVVNAMPKWTPGRQRGKLVKVKYMLPINFKLH